MKYTLNLLKLSLKNPRFYIESIDLKWRYIIVYMFLAVLVMGLGMTAQTYPFVQSLSDDMQSATEYLPEYSYSMDNLNLAEGEKPLYYNSDQFQLVIDDTVETDGSARSIPLSETQSSQISQTTPFSLFLFKDIAFVGIGDQVTQLPQSFGLTRTPNNLSVLLNILTSNQAAIIIGLIISFFLSNILVYLFEMVILALLIGFYNLRLTKRLTFGSRFKLAVMVSFIPLIIINLATLLFPGLGSVYTLTMFISVIIVHFVFKNHSDYIRQVLQTMQEVKTDKNGNPIDNKKNKKQKGLEDKSKDKEEE